MAQYDLTDATYQALTISATVMVWARDNGKLLPEDQDRLAAVQDELDARLPLRAGWGIQARV